MIHKVVFGMKELKKEWNGLFHWKTKHSNGMKKTVFGLRDGMEWTILEGI